MDGRRLTQPLTVTPDPRVELPAEAYAPQYALAEEIAAASAPVTSALGEAMKLGAAIDARRGQAGEKAGAALDAFAARLEAVGGIASGRDPKIPWWLPASPPAGLAAANAELDRLLRAVDGADATPSPDARAGFADARPKARAALAAWGELKSKDLAALDAALRAAGEPPLAP